MKSHITPGTWESDDSEKYYNGHVIRSNGMVVARVLDLGFESHGDREANARLIAAAPDLLAALRALRANVERELSGYWTESTANFMQQADAAIARAKGK